MGLWLSRTSLAHICQLQGYYRHGVQIITFVTLVSSAVLSLDFVRSFLISNNVDTNEISLPE